MMAALEFLGCFVGFIFIFLTCCSIKYNNPYKLHMWFGDKGCGKTTNLTRLAFKYMKKGWPVFTNENIPGTFKIDVNDIGQYEFPRKSLLLVDEGGIHYDNRNYKNFTEMQRDYYKLQRHYQNVVYIFSQTWDIDVKLRVLTDEIYMLRGYFNCISWGKRIMVKQEIVEATAESESRIVKNLKVMPIWIPGSRIFVWMPKYYKYFDSFAAPKLIKKTWEMTPFPEGVKLPRSLRRYLVKAGMLEPEQKRLAVSLKWLRRRCSEQDPEQETSDAGQE